MRLPWRHTPVVGAHAVATSRLFAVAWVSGLFSTLWALLMGVWILRHSGELFSTPSWVWFVDFLDGNKAIPGWIILSGGLLGVIGLVTRFRVFSYVSCFVCLAWCGWITAFLWTANVQGTVNVGTGFAILSTFVYIARFWLLVVTPDPGEEGGRGW